jgi:hypothetical protein
VRPRVTFLFALSASGLLERMFVELPASGQRVIGDRQVCV